MNCAVQWWEFSLIIKADGFCSIFYRWLCLWYLCISTWELWSLMNIGLIPFNSIGFFFAIVFTSFELGLQALYSAFEQALPWLPISWELFIWSELFFPSIPAKADRKSCILEHGKFQEENPCFAKALSAVWVSTLIPNCPRLLFRQCKGNFSSVN